MLSVNDKLREADSKSLPDSEKLFSKTLSSVQEDNVKATRHETAIKIFFIR